MLNTGINVHPGQWVRITAAGFIHFAAGGWPRSADGVDPAGNGRERANPSHPGPELTKNSLIAHVGGHTVQAGADMAFRAPAGGPVQLMVNNVLYYLIPMSAFDPKRTSTRPDNQTRWSGYTPAC